MKRMPKDFKTVNRTDNFYLANNIEKYGLSLDNSYHILPSLFEVAKLFKVPIETVIEIVKELEINNTHLFEFTTYKCVNNILIGEKLVYTTKMEGYGIKRAMTTDYYDVYLKEHEEIKVFTKNIIERLFALTQFCVYNDKMFLKEEKRFPEVLIGSITPKKLIRDIQAGANYDLTCQDICDIINNPETINEMKLKSLFRFYNDYNCCFLDLGEIKLHGKTYKESLQIPYQALITRNWGLIENVNVFSIIKHDANDKLCADPNNWYGGVQKDAPYFNHPLVNHLKTYFV